MLKEAWTLAIETLSWMQMRRLSEPLAFAKTVKQLHIQDSDSMKLAHRLISETVRRQNFIDKFINQVTSPTTIDEYDLGVQAFLRLYIYQTRIAKGWSCPDIKEAESIARLGRSILDWRALTKVERFLGFLLTHQPGTVFSRASDEERVGLQTFHPTWFVQYCFRLFGRRQALTMLEADIQPPPTYLRVNPLNAEEKEILERLDREGIKLQKIAELRHTYEVIETSRPVTRTESFSEGLCYVQDKASCFAVEVADPQPGMTVLDVCAAPGAKTTYLAQLMQNQGIILSLDYSRRRMTVWRGEVARMKTEIAEPVIVDARKTMPFTGEADVVVLDPPCTGTGTFAKSPSAKWRLTPQSIDKMVAIQWQMLSNCAERVKTGGAIIYSTCSITVEENEVLIERFLKCHSDFSLAEIELKIGSPGLRGLEKCQRLYPHIHKCNGFFVAKLLRNSTQTETTEPKLIAFVQRDKNSGSTAR